MKVPNIWAKNVGSTKRAKLSPQYTIRRVLEHIYKSEFAFSIWSCELGIMAKKVDGINKISSLTFDH
jgi:hypothetical protein